MTLEKPPRVLRDSFMSEKWDEINEGRNFKPLDAPLLEMLCTEYNMKDTHSLGKGFKNGIRF